MCFRHIFSSILGHEKKKKKNIRKANNLALGSYSLNKLQKKKKKILMGCLYMSYYPSKKDVECTMSHILEIHYTS